MGWMGMLRDVRHYLAVVGADRDKEGNFIIEGSIATGLDGEETVVHDTTRYFVDGKPKALAAGLSSTSQGLAVKVF